MAWMVQYPRLIEKNTFLDFAPEGCATRRASSAPATINESPANRRRSRRRKWAAKSALSDGAVALREYAARARGERWVLLTNLALARRRDIAWRWNRLVRGMSRKPLPQMRARVGARALLHLVQYAMRPADLIVLFATRVLRHDADQIEVWASDAQLCAWEIKRLLQWTEYFLGLAARSRIALYMPSHACAIEVQWDANLLLSELQREVAGLRGIPTEQQRAHCLGKELRGQVLSDTGISPGDIIEISSQA